MLGQNVRVRFVEYLCAAALLILALSPLARSDDFGWPNIAGNAVFSSPAIADLDGDAKAEVIITSVSAGVYVWHHDGTLMDGWPQATGHAFRASAAVGNLDADAELEIVVCTMDLQDVANENYVYVYNHDGTQLNGFPIAVEEPGARITSTPAIGNIVGTASLEVVLLGGDTYMYAWKADGTEVQNYFNPQSIDGYVDKYGNLVMTSSPALADTDNDGLAEVFIGSTTGEVYCFYHEGGSVSVGTPNWILASPAVGDIDDDGNYEVVVGSGDGNVYAWNIGSGTPPPVTLETGWPVDTDGVVYSSAALADIDGNDNGKLEIVCGSHDGNLYVWNHDGTLVPGWPQLTFGPIWGSPAVADMDGDNMPEIVVGSMARKVYIWNHDGTLLAGWPKTVPTAIFSSPAVYDLDGDGRMSVVIGSFDGKVYEWELAYDTTGSTFLQDWKMFCRNISRTAFVPNQ